MRDRGTIFYEDSIEPKNKKDRTRWKWPFISVIVLIIICVLVVYIMATSFSLPSPVAQGDGTPTPPVVVATGEEAQRIYDEYNQTHATPTPTPIVTNVTSSMSINNDTSFTVFQKLANNIGNQTPNNNSLNLTGAGGVDYTGLNMYPWIRYGYNDSNTSFMWTPEKWAHDMNGQGYSQRIELYNLWLLKTEKKTPPIKLEILHADEKTPYDFNKEAFVLGKYYDGYFKFTNLGDTPYQGDIAVVINASLYYAGSMLHLENMIVPSQFLSLYPGKSNTFYKKWNLSSYNGAPIPTGVLNIVIELRDLSDGQTLYKLNIKPTIAKDLDNNGYLSF